MIDEIDWLLKNVGNPMNKPVRKFMVEVLSTGKRYHSENVHASTETEVIRQVIDSAAKYNETIGRILVKLDEGQRKAFNLINTYRID